MFEVFEIDPGRAVLVFVVTAVISVLIIVLSRVLPALRGREGDLAAKQASHARPTPRIGGVAIFAGLWVAVLSGTEPAASAMPEKPSGSSP